MSLNRTQKIHQIIRIAQATRAVIDKSWIPEHLQGIHFFSQWDHWIFNTSEGDNVCEECKSHNAEDFTGSDLRFEFPYLEVRDENLVYPRVHPNCNCELVRLINVETADSK